VIGAVGGAAILGAGKGARAQASKQPINILYAATDRFQSIVDATLAGIVESLTGFDTRKLLLRPGIGRAEIDAWIAQRATGWILLGTEAREAVSSDRIAAPIVLGLQYLSSGKSSASGVSLDLSPDVVLPEAARLLPANRRIHVPFIRDRDEWLVTRIAQVAKMRGFQPLPAPASNLSEATDIFSALLRYGNPETDLCWVLGGSQLMTGDTSSHLLQSAYNNRFPIIANRLALVEQGGLLGGEPDFRHHGVQIGALMRGRLNGASPSMEPSARAELILNARAARRVGIVLSEAVRQRMARIIADD
jgi:hypothetical protein